MYAMAQIILLTILFSVITCLDAARILTVVPTPSISHQFVFRTLVQELVRIGHHVTMITTDTIFKYEQAPPNLTEIDVHDISYMTWNKELAKAIGTNNIIDRIRLSLNMFGTIIGQQLQMTEIQDLIKKKPHFDLVIAEACVRPALIFSYLFQAPILLMSSFGAMFGTNAVTGAPNHPLMQPLIVRRRLYNLTWWEKVRETYFQLRFEHLFYGQEEKENLMLRKIFGNDIPTLSELYNNVNVVFLNVHPIWNDNQPVPPGVIYVGGIHQNPPKRLPKELELYLNSSKHGVIYISFGTNVKLSMLIPSKVRMMIKVFSELPYDVIWNLNGELPDNASNIKVFNWLPQSDLLEYPDIKLFITQGGLQSTHEAINGGVPLIGIPLIGDQWYNAEKYVRHGIGKKLEMETFIVEETWKIDLHRSDNPTITEEEFKNAIREVIEVRSYKNNIIRLRELMRDEPLTPLERAIWWTEHVLRHGGARHVRSPAANMSWAEYYELNLVLLLLATLLTVVMFTFVAFCYLKRYIFVNHEIQSFIT